MAIVFRKNNQNAEILNESKFAQEDSMQEYLISNPEIVPIYEIEEDARLLVAARRDERLSTAKPAGRNRFYKLRLDPAVSLRK